MKKILFLFLLVFPAILFAQRVIKHTVVAKESYSSIGRLYNINGRELAEYNNLDYSAGLSIGQVLKVPVKAGTTIPTNTPAEPVEGTNQPIYHVLKQGESLYQLSRMYAPASVDDLRKWNNLTSDNLTLGDKLIVGYGKAKLVQTEMKTEETPAAVGTATPKVKSEQQPTKAEEKELKAEAKRIANEQKKLEAEASKIKKQQEEMEEKRLEDEQKEIRRKEKEQEQTPKKQVSSKEGSGFFKRDFTGREGEMNSGKAGVFKSTSGWEDEKYYALYDAARSGTILKITNKETGKVVYVKVLDIIPKLNENKSLILRLSNSAASALGAELTEFNCTIEF